MAWMDVAVSIDPTTNAITEESPPGVVSGIVDFNNSLSGPYETTFQYFRNAGIHLKCFLLQYTDLYVLGWVDGKNLFIVCMLPTSTLVDYALLGQLGLEVKPLGSTLQHRSSRINRKRVSIERSSCLSHWAWLWTTNGI